MRHLRAAICAVLLAGSPLASCSAYTFAAPPPGPAATGAAPPPGSGPILNGPGRPARPRIPVRARLRQLARQERILKRRMWRLRVRRRQFLAEGMPYHAHRVHERLIALGWRLRRVQATERALMIHERPMSPKG